MSLTHKLIRLLTSMLFVALIWSIAVLPAAAKGKKGKSKAVASRTKGKSGKQARSANGRLSRRELARRGKRGRSRVASDETIDNGLAANHPVVPDRIEVLEYGATNSSDLSRWLNPPPPSIPSNNGTTTDTLAPSRKKVSIESERVIQIQQALAKRGFYSGETTGVYDEATVDAMRRFQINNKIAVTGYPTAHSLKRLGLGNW